MPAKVKWAGRHFALVAALAMVVGLGAASAASAATKVPVWTTNGTSPMAYGTEVSFSGTSVHGMNLKWTSGGVPFYIECNTLNATGKVENYASGKPGTLTPGTAKFEGCRVVEVGVWETTCTVPSEIPFKYTSGELTNTPYSNGGLKLSGVLIKFIVSKCPHGAYEGLEWEFSGSVTGTESTGSWPGEVRFPEGTPLTVNAGATGAVIEFAENVQQGGSIPVKVIEEEIGEIVTGRHWYTGGGGRRGEGPRIIVAAGSPQTVKGSGDSLTIEGTTFGGLPLTVTCSAGSTEGSVENPIGGGDGTISAGINYTGCSVVKPENVGCIVEGGSIATKTLTGSWLAATPQPYLRMTGPSEQVAQFSLTGCTRKPFYLNVLHKVFGKLSLSENVVSPWSIPKALNENTLEMDERAATAYGTVVAESSKGGYVSWAK